VIETRVPSAILAWSPNPTGRIVVVAASLGVIVLILLELIPLKPHFPLAGFLVH
jgi:hypothetical protein